MKTLFVAWQSPRSRTIHPIARLLVHGREDRFEFGYIEGVRAAVAENFMPFTHMSNLERVYVSKTLFPVFANRLMSPTRPDYAEYVERLGLDVSIDPIVLMGRSEGRKPTDNLELFAPPSYHQESGSWSYHALVRGIRHVPGADQRSAELTPGDSIVVSRDPDPAHNPPALHVRTNGGEVLGWVPLTLVEDLNRLIEAGSAPRATVVRVNPAPAPVHQRVLVRIDAGDLAGFEPFSTPRYQSCSPDATHLGPTQRAQAS